MQAILRLTNIIMRGSAVALFAIMLALFFANVSVRIFFPEYAISISWAEEAARISMIWAIFLISGYALDRGRHIAMTSLITQLPRAARLALRRAIAVLGTVLFGYLCYVCITLMAMVFRTGQIFPDLRISTGYLYLGPAIGLFLLAVQYAVEIFYPNDPASAVIDES